ncbi:MAG: dihydrofolate reductase family protein [Candidatus Hydrothermarchaeales archaeon]
MKEVVLFIATSLDGYIADEDGGVDWLFTDGDYGYNEFIDSVDTLLIGRKTYDQILTFGSWPYKGEKCYVFTRSKTTKPDNNVLFSKEPVKLTDKLLEGGGKNIWLVGDSDIISLLFNNALIHRIVLSVHPIVLGKGIPLFKNINKITELQLVKSHTYENGLVQLQYSLLPKQK